MVFSPGCLQCIGVGACLDGAVPRWAGYDAAPSPYRAFSTGGGSTNGPYGTYWYARNDTSPSPKTLASAGEQDLGTFQHSAQCITCNDIKIQRVYPLDYF